MKKLNSIIFSCLTVFGLPASASKQRQEQLKPAPPVAIESLLNQYQIPSEALSFSFIELSDQQEIKKIQFRETATHIPASIIKTVTVVKALEQMGEDYTIPTELFYRGNIQNNILNGDLIIKGHGDPFLTFAQLQNFVTALRAQGIQKVNGNFYYDLSFYPTFTKISDIGLGDQSYNPAVAPLNLEFNQFRVFREASNIWKPLPQLEGLTPSVSQDKFIPGKKFKIQKAEKNKWQVSRHTSYQQVESLPIRNPALFLAESLQFVANKSGLKLPSPQELEKNQKNNNRTLVLSHQSKPLRDLAQATMEFSNNLFAETLLIHWYISRNNSPPQGLQIAANALLNQLRADYPKHQKLLDNWRLYNGSGLDTASQITAEGLSQLVAKWSSKQFGQSSFASFLSISGATGWMARRLNGPDYAYKVWAKTGSLDYVVNLTGLLYTNSNNAYAFTLLIQDLENRKLLDHAPPEQAQRVRNNARAWNQKAQNLADDILKHIISTN